MVLYYILSKLIFILIKDVISQTVSSTCWAREIEFSLKSATLKVPESNAWSWTIKVMVFSSVLIEYDPELLNTIILQF